MGQTDKPSLNDSSSVPLRCKNELQEWPRLPNVEYLHQLLPYDPATRFRKELQTGLKEYQLLLNAMLQAIEHYNNGRLEKFDSLVGENACQIRAIYIVRLASQKLNFSTLQSQILCTIKTIESIHPQKISLLIRNQKSLFDLFESNNLLIKSTKDEFFLIESFLLSEAKEICLEEQITSSLLIRNEAYPHKLKQFGDVSSKFTKHLVQYLRMLLSLDSVHWIRNIARKSVDLHLSRMVSAEFTKAHNNCSCIPNFWSFKAILNAIHDKKVPVIVHAKFLSNVEEGKYQLVNEQVIVYESQTLDGQLPKLIETTLENFDMNQPAMIIQGVVVGSDLLESSSWKQTMSRYSLDDVILAAAADHRQFPEFSDHNTIHLLNDLEFEKYRSLAKDGGFALENPSSFFMNHIYAGIPMHLPFIDHQTLSNVSCSSIS
ncbi:MAG: hypothetical protein HW387_708 [Parachlamydiales bacterium]|nr:hypothetical protein [Parachlamydiales bacterium]